MLDPAMQVQRGKTYTPITSECIGGNWWRFSQPVMCSVCNGFHTVNWLSSRIGWICIPCVRDIIQSIDTIPDE